LKTEERLTGDEFERIVSLSKEKSKEVIEETESIFQKLLKTCPKPLFVIAFAEWLEEEIDRKMKDIKNGKMWIDGWKLVDPYFLVNFRCIFPVVYNHFFEKGIKTTEFDSSFDSRAINEMLKETYDREVKVFLQIWKNAGSSYHKKLKEEELSVKVTKEYGHSDDVREWKGIPKSIIRELLGKMRKFSGECKYR